MSDKLSTDPYKGVRDFYPADWARTQAIFTQLRDTLARWGYQEYNASPLERAELYEAKTSEEIVSEQTYTFTDRGDRHVTLRPEMTPTLARMVAAKRREIPFPARWFSIPNVFRYERPQKGRLREHYQLNVDLFGVSGAEADVELITIAADLLKAFGAKAEDFVIKINDRRLFEILANMHAWTDIQKSPEVQRELLRLVDRKAKMPASEFEEALRNLGFPEDLFSPNYFTDEVKEQLGIDVLLNRLSAAGVTNVVWDPTITRGFDYYTGVVFEVFDTDPENSRSLFGGGRYDKLVSLFGGDPIPAIGFGMGDVTLSDFLETHNLPVRDTDHKPQLFIGTPSPSDIPKAQAFAATLREQGCRVFVNLTEKSLGDQIKDAVKRDIPHFLAYGAEERGQDTVRVKTLATGEETTLPAADLPTHLTHA